MEKYRQFGQIYILYFKDDQDDTLLDDIVKNSDIVRPSGVKLYTVPVAYGG